MGAVTYSVSASGYTVTVIDSQGNAVHEYNAGNSPLESSAVVSEGGLPVETLEQYAIQTAQELAEEYGEPYCGCED